MPARSSGVEAESEEAVAEPRSTTKKVVKYEGPHNERVIEARDWRSAGVEGQGKIVWGPLNDWTVDASDLNQTALNYVKNVDQTGLVITEVEVDE